jgi:hypothetical protein
MSKFEKIKENLLNCFDKLNDVLEIELRDKFCIIDHKGQSFIIVSIDHENNTFIIRQNGQNIIGSDFDSAKLFNIKNAKEIAFIPIDGKKGLLRFGVSCCDFIFFDDNNFCFVEFKLNAISLEERAIRKNRKKAISQLKNTIALFDDKLSKNYEGLDLEAYACEPKTYPDDGWEDFRIAFLEEVGIFLSKETEKVCE